jgi:PAS domain S-box-containing protein
VNPDSPAQTRVARRFSAGLGLYAICAGVLTLIGWATDTRRLTAWDNAISQMPNNAIAVTAAGLSLLAWYFGRPRLSALLGAVTASIAGATLFEHVTGINLGIDTLVLYREWGQMGTVAPGRMGLPGAVALSICGAAIALRATRHSERLALAGGFATIAIAMLSLIGYLFDARPLHAIPRLTTVAFQTSTALLALGLGLVAGSPDREPMRRLLGDSGASVLLRRALLGVVFLPLLLGWLQLQGVAAGLFDVAFGSATLVFVLIVLFLALLWWTSGAIADHESTLRESERKFALLFEKGAFGAALARLPEGILVDVNDAFVSMFGYRREEAIGKTSLEIGINPDPALRERILRALQEQGFLRDQEMRLFTRSGEARTFLNNMTMIEIGGVPHLLTTVQDITESKAAENALRRSAEALRAADRMKDEFLATLSHELRTPLTAIIGWSHLLLTGGLDEQEVRIGLEAIRSSANAQAQLTDDILDVSRITTGKMRLQRQEISLPAVIEAAVGTVLPAAEARQIALNVNLDRELPRLFLDPERMQQVTWNLLSNAIKFSPPGAVVQIELLREGNEVVLHVTDRGKGIARAFLPFVFERFRQADSSPTRSYAGLGIGLALAKELVELHGGRISVESEEGRGSRFTVRLPLPMATVADRVPESATPLAKVSNLQGRGVLYVDDREDARVLIARMLEAYGAQMMVASSVEEALAALADGSVDVVLTDLAMPDQDGYDLLAAIRENPRWKDLPVIALTAQGRLDDEHRAVTAGFHSFLRKPIEPETLACSVADALPAATSN